MDSGKSDRRRCISSHWFGENVLAGERRKLPAESRGLLGVCYRPDVARRNEGPQPSHGLLEHTGFSNNREQLLRSPYPAAGPEAGAAAASKNDSVKTEFLLGHLSSHQHNTGYVLGAKTEVYQLALEQFRVRHRYAQKRGWLGWLERCHLQRCGQKPSLSRLVRIRALGIVKFAGAPKKNQKLKLNQVAFDEGGSVALPTLGGEKGASGEQVLVGIRRMQGKRQNLSAARSFEGSHLERFLDMQVTRLARGIDAAIIIDAIGQIRILLYFANDHPRTNGVLGARRDEVSLARTDRIAQEELLDGSFGDGVQKSITCDAGLETKQEFRMRFGRDDMPHFCLPAAAGGPFEPCCKGIVRMNLNRQKVIGKKKLHQHGKFRAGTETWAP